MTAPDKICFASLDICSSIPSLLAATILLFLLQTFFDGCLTQIYLTQLLMIGEEESCHMCVCVYYVEAGDNSIVVLIDLQNSSKCRLLLLFLCFSLPQQKKFNTSNERWGRNCISDGKLFAINIIPLQPPYMPHSRFHIETGTLS